MRKAASVFFECLLALILLAAAVLYVPRLFGIESFSVEDGSMEPLLARGSLVYVVPTEKQSIASGVLVAYRYGDAIEIHKVTGLDVNGDFIVKAEAAESRSPAAVPYSNIIGVIRIRILYAGIVQEFMGSTEGKITAVAVVAAILAVIVLLHLGKESRGSGGKQRGSPDETTSAFLPERMKIPETGVYSEENRYMPGSAGAGVFRSDV
ncbi:MAG: S26 family signal peptidase [Oscillospiraceae bacterium]|jgi:signal peptidase|nr:S26 family signal peptidase [Oscillospiraceae bacterium]